MIIDFHTHVFSPQIKNDRSKYIAADPSFAALYTNKEAKLATAEELIASMDRDEVDISVITNLGWLSHEMCVATNDYILESIARYPRRLVGFGAVPTRSLEAALTEVERCARGGMRGIGEIRPDTQFDLNEVQVTVPLVAALRQHNLILLTHSSEPVGHNYPGKGRVTPEVLYSFITRFPDLTVVCAHWGGGLPFYALMPEVKKALGNVYFDTAASPFLYRPAVYHQVISLVGSDRVLFGSDYPLMPQRRLLDEIRSLSLSPETTGLILAGNARRLLGLNKV